jgi:hypothetical protein
MNRSLMLLSLASLSAFGATEAHADAVTERVYLTAGAAGCGTGSLGFRRINQNPDGSHTIDTAEYQVPYGQYLEITSIEYTIPYWTPWAKFYTQSIEFNLRQRYGTQGTNILSVRYSNSTTFVEDEKDNYLSVSESVAPGAQTHVAAFPSGPLMGNAARLCVTPSNNSQYWMYGGNIRARGRLIASGEPPMAPGGGGSVFMP